VHGAEVLRLQAGAQTLAQPADAAITTDAGIACTVLVADCLPVLFAAPQGRGVGAAHAGWRGLAGGVLEATVAALCDAAACPPSELLAWLGPCIGPRQFEVGADVLEAFAGATHFVPRPRADGAMRWLADLPGLARERLRAAGLSNVSGGAWCTVEDGSRFFSFRRDGVTGRMAAAVWLRR
jgi:YfiH family protein